MTIIKGYLKNGASKTIKDAVIVLKAQKTTNTVLVKTEAFEVTNDGYYEMNVPPCTYDVVLLIDGFPPKQLGVIEVFENSKTGSLNDFLIMPKSGQIVTEDIIEQMSEHRIKAENAAQKAIQTVDNTLKKTGEKEQTVNGMVNIDNINTNGTIKVKAPVVDKIPAVEKWEVGLGDNSIISSAQWAIFNGIDYPYLGGTSNMTIASWWAVGFSPLYSLDGQPQNNTVSIDCRAGTVNARGGFFEDGIKLVKEGDVVKKTLTIESNNAFRLKNTAKNISAMVRFDGEGFWILFTDKNNSDGEFNHLRPFYINATTGHANFQHGVSSGGVQVLRIGDYGIGTKGMMTSSTNRTMGSAFIAIASTDADKPDVNGGVCGFQSFSTNNSYGMQLVSTNNANEQIRVFARSIENDKKVGDWVEFIRKGDYGIGSHGATFLDNNFDEMNVDQSGFYNLGKDSKGTFPQGFSEFCSMIHITRSDNKADKKGSQIIIDTHNNRIAYRTTHINGFKNWAEFITTANSTIDSNGFLKKASPILRLFADDTIEETDGFKKSGCALVNDLATGVTAKRIDVGHYEIDGSFGFAKEGWYITLPEDANGNKKFFAEYSTDENNVITVKTYTKKFDFERCEIVAGDPVDISKGRWIDLRLEIPTSFEVESSHVIPSLLNPVMVSVNL